MESKTGRTFTRSLRASSLTDHNKSALTDHATQENHVINWSQATVIDTEPERFTRWIKEAIHIRNEGQQADSAGVRAGDAASVGWQVTLCDPI